jgi:hypothetical protein
MNCSNLFVLHRLAQSSLNRLASPSLGINRSLKSIHSGIGYRFEQKLLLNKKNHEITIVRWQFDFTKKPPGQIARKSKWFSGSRKLPKTSKERNLTTLLYLFSLAILTTGASYAAVPLYRVFCQVWSLEEFKLCFVKPYHWCPTGNLKNKTSQTKRNMELIQPDLIWENCML